MRFLLYPIGFLLFILLGYFGYQSIIVFRNGWVVVGGVHGPKVTQTRSDLRFLTKTIIDRRLSDENLDDSGYSSGKISEVWPDLHDTPIGSLPISEDPFHPGHEYWGARWKNGFLLASVGPDGVLDVTDDTIRGAVESGDIQLNIRYTWTYSPTNGSTTRGDILRYEGP